jgi:hypothetical protein
VEVSELATRSLDHADIVAGGVVRSPSALPKSVPVDQTIRILRLLKALRRGQTYVGESGGRHFDGLPEDSDGGVTTMRVSGVRWAIKYAWASDGRWFVPDLSKELVS